MCIDQYSLDTHTVDLKAGRDTPVVVCGLPARLRPIRAKIYYTMSIPTRRPGRPSWFSAGALYRYDIDKGTQAKVCDLAEYGIHFYSSGLRVNPVDGLLYGYYYSGGISSNTWGYFTIEDDGSDELVTDNETSLISNYWYPAMVIFPDTEAPVVGVARQSACRRCARDNRPRCPRQRRRHAPGINHQDHQGSCRPRSGSATLERGKLVVNGLAVGTTSVTVEYDAGGKFATAVFDVDVVKTSGIGDIPGSDECSLLPTAIFALTAPAG